MKTKKIEDNPIVHLDNLSEYISKEDIAEIIKKELLVKKPKWFIEMVKEIISGEIKKHLRISLSGYNSVDIKLKYEDNIFAHASHYHPRGHG